MPARPPRPAPLPPPDEPGDADAAAFGAALRAIRARRGLRQQELAAAAGLSPAQLSLFESGARLPAVRTLRRLAAALDTTLDALFADGGAEPAAPAAAATPAEAGVLPGMQDLFRTPEEALFAPLAAEGVVRTTRRDAYAGRLPAEEDVRRLERRILDYRRLETICGAFRQAAIPLSLPFREDAEGAEMLAGRVRESLGLGDSILHDYVSVLENHGVRVVFLPLSAGVESLSFHDARSDSAFIAVDDSRTAEKQLFRMAVELAWLYLFARNGRRAVPEAAEANRRFANLFAACFLLPRSAVLSAAASLGAGRGDWTYRLVLRVKRHFGASAEAFAYRLLELGLLSDAELSAILAEIRRHYAAHRNREPGEALPPLVRNGRLADLVERARGIPGAADEAAAIARRAGVPL
ncbi:MAG: ImmA/IrrE family metallo-endopeptidase [Kiritimatiellae bacterium]|nr:ImmA/IrrE family metallo-endopeptidase [Kiritimatiellia bacterium]